MDNFLVDLLKQKKNESFSSSSSTEMHCWLFTGGFHGDVFLLLKLLLPGVIKAVYNLQDKQLVKCFGVVFDTDLDEMIEDLEQGDVAETIALFFDKSNNVKPQKKSTLSLQEVVVVVVVVVVVMTSPSGTAYIGGGQMSRRDE